MSNDFHLLYEDNICICDKIEKIARNIYHAEGVNYSKEAKEKIEVFEKLGYGNYPVCIAKTQYSISDDPKKLGYPKGYEIQVRDVNIYTGAGFIVVYLGNIMTMPGLSKEPAYLNMNIDNNGNISGLF